jgi:GNAT superfamily N-acetyltransferase
VSDFYTGRRLTIKGVGAYAGFLIGFFGEAPFAWNELTLSLNGRPFDRAVLRFGLMILGAGLACGAVGNFVGGISGRVWEATHRRRRRIVDDRSVPAAGETRDVADRDGALAAVAKVTADALSAAGGTVGVADDGGVGAAESHGIRYARETPELHRFITLARRTTQTRHDPIATARALAASINVAAWDGPRLVGMARVVTDGTFVAIVPHLMVDPEYRRRGIGRRLLALAVEAAPVPVIVPGTAASGSFFSHVGAQPWTDGFLIGKAAVAPLA